MEIYESKRGYMNQVFYEGWRRYAICSFASRE